VALDGGYLDLPALEHLREGFAVPAQAQPDLGSRGALDERDGDIDRTPRERPPVDGDDDVTAADAGARGRRTVDDIDHAQPVLDIADADPDALKPAVRGLLEAVVLPRRQVGGELVVEQTHSCCYRRVLQTPPVHVFDVVGLDVVDGRGDDAGIVECIAECTGQRVGARSEHDPGDERSPDQRRPRTRRATQQPQTCAHSRSSHDAPTS